MVAGPSTQSTAPYLLISGPSPPLAGHAASWLSAAPHIVFASLRMESETEVQGHINHACADLPPGNLTTEDLDMMVTNLAHGLPAWAVNDLSAWHDAMGDYQAHIAEVEGHAAARKAQQEARRAEKLAAEAAAEEEAAPPAKKKAKRAAAAAAAPAPPAGDQPPPLPDFPEQPAGESQPATPALFSGPSQADPAAAHAEHSAPTPFGPALPP